MYTSIPRQQMAEMLSHLRSLFRRKRYTNAREEREHERREVVTRNLLSNLTRLKEHPTLNAVLEVADIFSLTLEGAHRLFGYALEEIRDYDLRFNGRLTHIIESYPFRRDLPVDLPLNLGGEETLSKTSTLGKMVTEWQTGVPIETLESRV